MGAAAKTLAAFGAAVVLANMTSGHHHHHGWANLLSAASVPASGGGGPAANQALGDAMAASLNGWHGHQRECLNVLWDGESGWRTNADTRVTGLTAPGQPYAFGIPQAYPAQKMASAGGDWQSNPATQIKWGLSYIETTYGNPCNALAYKRSHGNRGY
jgi:hypothetical protein